MNKLITNSLIEGNVNYLIRFNLKLLNIIEIRYIEWVADYLSKYSKPPTLTRFKTEFPTFVEISSKEPLADLFQQEIVKKKNLYFRQKVMEMEEELVKGADPTDLVKHLNEVFTVTVADVVSNKTYDRATYFEKKESLPFFVPFLDRFLGGISPGDLVFIAGRPGSNKTTFCEQMISLWVLVGYKILYITNENAPQEVMPKLDAFQSGFNPINYRYNTWTKEDKLRVQAATYLQSAADGAIEIVRDPVTQTKEIEGLIKSIEPDIVIVDGTYLMSESGHLTGDWKVLQEVSRNLKRIARRTRTGILGIIQAARTAENTRVERDMLAGTDAFLQDADSIISANLIDGLAYGQIIKSRWGLTPFGSGFQIKANFGKMFVSTNDEMVSQIDELITVEDW